MNVGDVVYFREADVAGLPGYLRRMSEGHALDPKRRGYLVIGRDDHGVVLAGMTSRPLTDRCRGKVHLPASGRRGAWSERQPGESYIRDIRRIVVLCAGTPAFGAVYASPRRYDLRAVPNLLQMFAAMRVPWIPERAIEEIKNG